MPTGLAPFHKEAREEMPQPPRGQGAQDTEEAPPLSSDDGLPSADNETAEGHALLVSCFCSACRYWLQLIS